MELKFGVINFDNLGNAFLTIFQCITMEGWTEVMYQYQDVSSIAFVNTYFILCVVICSFFLLNLTIAVMLMEYENLDKNDSNSFHKQELKSLGREAGLPIKLTEFLISQSNLTIGKKGIKLQNERNKKTDGLCKTILAT